MQDVALMSPAPLIISMWLFAAEENKRVWEALLQCSNKCRLQGDAGGYANVSPGVATVAMLILITCDLSRADMILK